MTGHHPARVVALIDAARVLVEHTELLVDYAGWGDGTTDAVITAARDAVDDLDPTGLITIEARRAALEGTP